MVQFVVGDRVYRVDSGYAANVTAVVSGLDEMMYALSYDEGGSGTWPESALQTTFEEWNVRVSSRLTDAKKTKLSELAAVRYAHEVSGTTFNSMQISTDTGTQSKFAAIVLATIVDPNYTVNFKLPGGGFIMLNAAQIGGIAQAARSHVQACYDREMELSVVINAAVDLATLDSIDINTGWPT